MFENNNNLSPMVPNPQYHQQAQVIGYDVHGNPVFVPACSKQMTPQYMYATMAFGLGTQIISAVCNHFENKQQNLHQRDLQKMQFEYQKLQYEHERLPNLIKAITDLFRN